MKKATSDELRAVTTHDTIVVFIITSSAQLFALIIACSSLNLSTTDDVHNKVTTRCQITERKLKIRGTFVKIRGYPDARIPLS